MSISWFERKNQLRARLVVKRIIPYLSKSRTILDIGSGTGHVTEQLLATGYKVTPVDVVNYHVPRKIIPTYYDGAVLPYKDNVFDTALLLMVMHHAPDPHKLLAEAMRVARDVVVIETSYVTWIDKLLTVFVDTAVNLQATMYWNSYKTDSEWRSIFKKFGLQIKFVEKYPDKTMGISFLHLVYHLRAAAG